MAQMKLLPLLLLLPAAAPYRAHGTEPFWDFSIAGGRMILSSSDSPSLRVATPRPRAILHGRRYATRVMTVEITREGRCNDGMSEREYPDTVRLFFGRSRAHPLEGCGGPELPPQALADSGWKIIGIDGEVIAPTEDYRIEFGGGRISGQAGCNRFSGPYREARPTLSAGPLIATRMACSGARMRHEARVLNILAGPVRIAFPDGLHMTLTGSGGMIRLVREA